MNILAYAHTYLGTGHNAGAETTLHDILSILKRAGHKATALASRPFKDGSGSYVLDGVMVQAYASKHDPELYFPRFDIILTQFECAQRAWYIGQKLGIPTVQLVHNNTQYSTNLALRYNTHLVYNAAHVRDSIERLMPGDNRPATTLHPPVNPKAYACDTTREYITLVNLSDGEEPFYDKGYETFYRLAEAFPNEKFLGVKGAYGNQVVRERDNVTILEHTNNILEVYRKSKIILAPSEIESWGRVPIEAACSGIPSLTSTAPGLLESGIGYRQIPFGEYSEWADALSDLLDNYAQASAEAKTKALSLDATNQYEINDFVSFIEKIGKK